MSGGEPVRAEKMVPAEKPPWGTIGLLFMAHFVVDSQVSFLSPLLPLLREKFGLTLGAAGALIGLLGIFNAGSQPITAIVTDRWPRLPWLGIGLIGSAIFLTAAGWLSSYAAVAIAVSIGGALAGLAHPDMASRAGALSDRHRSLAVSIFVAGGRLGFSLGPIIALFIVKWWGMEWLWIYVGVNIAAVAGITRGLPKLAPAAGGGTGHFRGLGTEVWAARYPLSILLGVTVSRAIVTVNMQGLLPTLYVERGLGLWQGGIANSVLLFFGMAGVMTGGALADRIGKRKVIGSGIAASIVGLIGFLLAPPWFAMACIALLGFGLYMPMGVGMAYAQEFLPAHRGFASSLTLGVSWGLASFSVIPISRVAEDIGLLQTFWVLPASLVVGMIFTYFLPEDRKG